MAKIVKIKQKDIENIVKNIVVETTNEFKSLEKDANLSEPYADSESKDILVHKAEGATENDINPDGREGIIVVRREDGGIYLMNNRTGEILGQLQ